MFIGAYREEKIAKKLTRSKLLLKIFFSRIYSLNYWIDEKKIIQQDSCYKDNDIIKNPKYYPPYKQKYNSFGPLHKSNLTLSSKALNPGLCIAKK